MKPDRCSADVRDSKEGVIYFNTSRLFSAAIYLVILLIDRNTRRI